MVVKVGRVGSRGEGVVEDGDEVAVGLWTMETFSLNKREQGGTRDQSNHDDTAHGVTRNRATNYTMPCMFMND